MWVPNWKQLKSKESRPFPSSQHIKG
jgi:hypothetical protein